MPRSLFLRVALAVVIGAVAGTFAYLWFSANPGYRGGDFTYAWRAAGHLLEGRNPYANMPPAAYGAGGPFLYPLPTAMLTLPFSILPVHAAAASFFGLSVALMVFAVAGERPWQLWMLTSSAFVTCITTAQWSPLIVSAALLPSVAWVAVAKPNLAIAAFAYRPSWSMLIGGLTLGLLGLVLVPAWPLDWIDHIRSGRARHEPIGFTSVGFLALLALLRWRTREGRLVAALACMPTAAWPYDHLLLWLTTRNWQEAIVLSVCSWGVLFGILATAPHDLTRDASTVQTLLALGLYLPATYFVLRRPNDGVVAHWLERIASHLPRWLRGSAIGS